jgi:spermidine synthase
LLDLRTLQGEAAPQRVGLVGLGVGTLTAYARRGDHYRLYELNPAVPDLARRHFTYLADCAGDAQVVLGDARLSLEREPPQQFDVLAVDAFSSDSIPVHLMTQEALAVYLRHLRPGGVVVFHVSNRYLKLAPVVRQLAATAGLQAWQFIDAPPKSAHLSRSDWVAVTANTALLQAWRDQGAGQPVEPLPGLRLWRDDQYDLLQVLK